MKRASLKFGILAAGLGVALPVAAEPLGTAFTYQGSLIKAGAPVSEPQDFEFGLYDSALGTGQVGTTVSLPNVNVTNGLFNVDLDFGAGAFGAEKRYLHIAVRPTGDGTFTSLSPRAAVMPAPVALTVGPGGVTNQSIADGTITPEKLAPTVNPKYLSSLDFNFIPWILPDPVQFTPTGPWEGFIWNWNGVVVENAGTYVVSVRLTCNADYPPFNFFNAHIHRNGSSIRALANNVEVLPGTTVYSSVEILQLDAGDELSVMVWGGDPYVEIIGDMNRSTTFDIIRID